MRVICTIGEYLCKGLAATEEAIHRRVVRGTRQEFLLGESLPEILLGKGLSYHLVRCSKIGRMDMLEANRIAVVDDEAGIREMLEVGLSQQGFLVRTAIDGPDGLGLVRDWHPHCIVLDVMLPKIDGISLIPLVRSLTDVPIILLTARGDVRDRIDGLRAGADDYLAKPFDIEELAMRVQAALRRPMLKRVSHLRFADLEIDLESRTVKRAQRWIDVSTREFDLLATLMRRPNRVFTREELLDLVWGSDRDVSTSSVETYVSYVRAKIDLMGLPRLIHTIRGVGYTLRE